MFMFISTEVLLIVFSFLSLCADSLLGEAMLWITAHWTGIQICVCLLFSLVIVFELFPAIKKVKKSLVVWFAFWNVIRSFVASQYALF